MTPAARLCPTIGSRRRLLLGFPEHRVENEGVRSQIVRLKVRQVSRPDVSRRLPINELLAQELHIPRWSEQDHWFVGWLRHRRAKPLANLPRKAPLLFLSRMPLSHRVWRRVRGGSRQGTLAFRTAKEVRPMPLVLRLVRVFNGTDLLQSKGMIGPAMAAEQRRMARIRRDYPVR